MTTATARSQATTRTGTRCYTLREVAALFGVRPETIRAWVKEGRFPQPLPVSPRKFLWAAADVEAVLSGEPAGGRRGAGRKK